MRKLTRTVLRVKAYELRGGNKLFRMLWKDLRKKQGLSYPGSKQVKSSEVKNTKKNRDMGKVLQRKNKLGGFLR